MNREIKFRAILEFRDGFKLMLNPVTVSPDMIGFSYDLISDALKDTKYSLEDDGVYWADENHFDKMYDLLSGEDYFWAEGVEPMQYTGRKDKNGKEIYEGDTVIGMNVFSPEMSEKIKFDEFIYHAIEYGCNEIEVIENPELLPKKHE